MTHYGKCPKCKNKNYGHIFKVGNLIPENAKVMCFHGYCDFSMNILEWNALYPHMKFRVKNY
jgi:hypothetical protein